MIASNTVIWLPAFCASISSSASASASSSNEVTGVRVLWEPDPLDAPGKFCTLPGSEQLTDQLNDLVRVSQVRPPSHEAPQSEQSSPGLIDPLATDPSTTSFTNNPVANSNLPAPGPLPELTCYPDGSSDSAEIVLRPLDEDDLRVSVVTLSGVSGELRHRFISPAADGLPSPDTDSPLAAPTSRPLVQ